MALSALAQAVEATELSKSPWEAWSTGGGTKRVAFVRPKRIATIRRPRRRHTRRNLVRIYRSKRRVLYIAHSVPLYW